MFIFSQNFCTFGEYSEIQSIRFQKHNMPQHHVILLVKTFFLIINKINSLFKKSFLAKIIKFIFLYFIMLHKEIYLATTIKYGGRNVMVQGCVSCISLMKSQVLITSKYWNIWMLPSFNCLVRIAIIKNDNDLKHFTKTTVSKEASQICSIDQACHLIKIQLSTFRVYWNGK